MFALASVKAYVYYLFPYVHTVKADIVAFTANDQHDRQDRGGVHSGTPVCEQDEVWGEDHSAALHSAGQLSDWTKLQAGGEGQGAVWPETAHPAGKHLPKKTDYY